MPFPLTFNTPGRWGVNFQEQNQLLHPNWATTTDGLTINDAGQLQCRGAFDLVSTDGAPTAILRQFVYVNSAGTEVVISSTATKIISGIADLDDAATDITSSTTPTNGYWQFQNFNGKVVGWQAGHTPIVKTSGDFADIVAGSGTLPDGDSVCAAFGRLWAVDDDGQTVRYCALLDETLWDAADGGGAIDMRNVWPRGMDRVTAIAAFGANLVIFGRRCIVIYTDGSGSTLGLDPTQMYVVDTIDGTGCVARDTVCVVGEGDLVFLSELGLQSFSRVVQSKDNPLDTISWQIADFLSTFMVTAGLASATDLRNFTGSYIPKTRQYMLMGAFLCVFHMGGRTQDELGRPLVPITVWSTGLLTGQRGFITTRSGITYTAGSATHEIYKYDTTASLDEGNAAIAVQYRSGWLKFDSPEFDGLNKFLKMAQLTLLNPAGIDSATSLTYAADYSTTVQTLTPVYTYDDDRVIVLYDPSGDIEGQYFRVGFVDASFGLKVLTQLQLQFKTGRTAFIHKKFSDVAASEAFVAATAPVISSIDPALIAVGATTFTIIGTGFTVDSVAQWEGEDRTTTFVSSTELSVTTQAGDVDATGTFDVTVTNVIGGVSNTATATVVTFAVWDPATAGANITISGAGLIATRAAASAWQSVRSTIGKSAGKWYWEYTFTSGANEIIMGAGDAALSASNFVGSSSNSTGFQAITAGTTISGWRAGVSNTVESATLWIAGDVVNIAMNMDTGEIWVGKNGTWLGSGNPVTGDSPAFTGLTGPQYAATSMFDARAVTANFGATDFANTVPSGFNAGLYS